MFVYNSHVEQNPEQWLDAQEKAGLEIFSPKKRTGILARIDGVNQDFPAHAICRDELGNWYAYLKDKRIVGFDSDEVL